MRYTLYGDRVSDGVKVKKLKGHGRFHPPFYPQRFPKRTKSGRLMGSVLSFYAFDNLNKKSAESKPVGSGPVS
jgi:hypothetical protein